jgi:hypothetical protein
MHGKMIADLAFHFCLPAIGNYHFAKHGGRLGTAKAAADRRRRAFDEDTSAVNGLPLCPFLHRRHSVSGRKPDSGTRGNGEIAHEGCATLPSERGRMHFSSRTVRTGLS